MIKNGKLNVYFDVESTELYGDGFAVGSIVLDPKGNLVDCILLDCKSEHENACQFVKDNVLEPLTAKELNPTYVQSLEELRTDFYYFMQKYKTTGNFISDCNYPVETNFLNAIVKDDSDRTWNMPYPLYDVSNDVDINTSRKLVGYEDLVHNPIIDCIGSAKLHYWEKFRIILDYDKIINQIMNR